MIDVIIPVYNSHDKIYDSLASLVTQSKDKVVVTLLDDCSEKDYYDQIELLKDDLLIT